jgi:hypothetical protein
MSPRIEKINKKVWVACRAKARCEGKESLMVFKRKLATGGKTIRYRCLTCGCSFHVTL